MLLYRTQVCWYKSPCNRKFRDKKVL